MGRGHERACRLAGNILSLVLGAAYKGVCIYVKHHCTIQLIVVHSIICKLYLNF